MLNLLPSWFGWLKVNAFHRPGVCQVSTYLEFLCDFLSPWAVVSFTCERYIEVFMPLKRLLLCMVKRARTTVLILSGLALLLYNVALWPFARWMDLKTVSVRHCHSISNF